MNVRSAELDDILAKCWLMLETGASRSSAPFHTAVIGTIGAGICKMRTVVLRRVITSQRLLMCHSDRRSAKIKELETCSRLSWLWYDRESKIQIRAEGRARVHVDDALSDEQWKRSSPMSRRCYCGEKAPGAVTAIRTSGLPKRYQNRSPTSAESEAGRRNFVVISCKLDYVDWLHLSAKGHSRAQFVWSSGKLDATWVIP